MKLLVDMNLSPRWVHALADVTPEALGNQLVAALRQMEPELLQGALLTVDSGRTRLRVLPLQRSLQGPAS